MKKLLFLTLALLFHSAVNFAQQRYHDAAAFYLVGDVQQVFTQLGTLCFNVDGSLNKAKSTALADYSKYQIKRNAAGYPVKITTEYDVTTFEYDTEGYISKKTVRGSSNYTTTYARREAPYNSDIPEEKRSLCRTFFVDETVRNLSGGAANNRTESYLCEQDYKGNWISKISTSEAKMRGGYRNLAFFNDVDFRTVVYYAPMIAHKKSKGQTSIVEMIQNPIFVENGHSLFRVPYKDVKKVCKSLGMKCEKYMGSYYFKEHGKTFYGEPVEAELDYTIDPNKVAHPVKYAYDYRFKPYFSRDASIHDGDLLNFLLQELIEVGATIKPASSLLQVVHFEYDGIEGAIERKGNINIDF